MIRKSCLLISSAALALLFLPASANAATSTSVTMTFTEADGLTPMANANVGVFYMTPAQAALPDGSTFTMTTLGSGSTNSAGLFSGTIDTSSVPAADLGDIGNGTADSFNAVVEAIDPSGYFAFSWVILTEGATFTSSASVSVPAAAGSVPAASAPALSGQGVVLAHAFRYTPVTPLNSGYGMQAVLTYTTDSTTSRQTEVTAADIGQNGGVSVGGYQLEERSRSIVSPDTQSGSYHKWVWANYDYEKVRVCAQNCGGLPAIVWKPYQFTGQAITDYNKDKDNSGTVIGTVAYGVPSFTPGSSNQDWFPLKPSNSGWSRASGTREGNDVNGMFTFPFASSIGVDSLTTYGSITSVTYNWIPSGNCGTGLTRVIWGHNSTPGNTTRIQANCFPNSILP